MSGLSLGKEMICEDGRCCDGVGNSMRYRFSSFFNSELPMGHGVTYLSSLCFNILTYKNTDHIALLLGHGDPKSSNDVLVSIWHMCSQIDFPAGRISLWPFKTFSLLLQNTKCLLLSGINQRTSIQCLLANEKKKTTHNIQKRYKCSQEPLNIYFFG